MQSFKGLNVDHLPPRLLRQIDRRFAAINQILAHYAHHTWDDYRSITDADLRRLQNAILGLAAA